MVHKKITKEKINLVYELYEKKLTPKAIANDVGISDTSVRNIIRTKFPECDLHYSRRKYYVDTDYFKIIDTEKKAYFLGLMYADGCVLKRKGSLLSKIALVKEDSYLLKEFKKEIKTSYPFYEYKRSKLNSNWKDVTEFRISNTEFTTNLIKLGCGFKKSNNLNFPSLDIVPLNLRSHFIRGYFDGDGSVCNNKDTNRKIIRFEGTLEFLIELQKHFFQELNLPFNKIQKRHRDRLSNAYTLQYAGNIKNNNCKVFFDYLYKDATVFLVRKHDKF